MLLTINLLIKGRRQFFARCQTWRRLVGLAAAVVASRMQTQLGMMCPSPPEVQGGEQCRWHLSYLQLCRASSWRKLPAHVHAIPANLMQCETCCAGVAMLPKQRQ
jgi:hypothetical protein